GKRTANRRVGLWSALIFPVFYFTETFWTLTQNDGIAAVVMTLAVFCAFRVWDAHTVRRRFAWAFAAGLLSGYTVWFKYPFALFGVALAVGYALLPTNASPDDKRGWRGWIVPGIVYACGGLLLILGGAAYLAAQGALDALIESARVTSQYTALTFNGDDFRQLMETALGFRWQQWGLLLILAAFWPLGRWLGDKRGAGWRVILLWLLAGLGMMLVQAKGYDYHWLPMLPPLALLAADSLDRILSFMKRWGRADMLYAVGLWVAGLGLLAVLVVGIWSRALPYLTGQESQMDYYHHFQGGEFVADESLAVANLLRERVVPGDSLFIWGFRPEVYYLSDLNPATRFIFQFPLVADWYPPEWKQETVDTLWAAMPPYVLVLQVDYMPWVTGSHEDSNGLLQSFTELNNWLIYNYEFDTQIGNFFIWRRKTVLP
ncbi:MAG: glycosyltransferase family 39 protein, partial [Anaerolineae bacterium]|nr:glycosyltransferase family 39 protein [Anaerolineae bacterium]